MNILPIDNSNSFKGTLSKKVVKQIRKAEKANILSEVKSANSYGEVLAAEKIDTIRKSTTAIIEKLENLAKDLPKKAKIVLQEKYDGLYIRGKFSDKYTDEDFYVFNPYGRSPIGRLTNSKKEYLSMSSLSDQAKEIISAKEAKNNIESDIKYSLEVKIDKGKIKSEEALQKRYDYYKEEFPNIESKKEYHLKEIKKAQNKENAKNENIKFLPLGQRILAKLGF